MVTAYWLPRVIENYECQWSRRAAAPTRLGSAKADKWSIGKELTSLQVALAPPPSPSPSTF